MFKQIFIHQAGLKNRERLPARNKIGTSGLAQERQTRLVERMKRINNIVREEGLSGHTWIVKIIESLLLLGCQTLGTVQTTEIDE